MSAVWVLGPPDAQQPAPTDRQLSGWGLVGSGRASSQRVVYDTFDWRLHGAGLTLVGDSTEGSPTFTLVGDGTQTHQGADDLPEVIRPLPAGPVADRLAAVVDDRALLGRARVLVRFRPRRLLDERDKTIAHVRVEQVRLPRPHRRAEPESESESAAAPATVRMVVEALRGYDDEVAAAVAALGEISGWRTVHDAWVQQALAAAGCVPGDYSARLLVPMEPGEPAGEALTRVLVHLWGTVEANEDGVRRDLDPEFLHDLRVAVRRTRSLLKVAAPLFGDGRLVPFAEEFRWLAGATSPLRDLDVHLAEFDQLAEAVPEAWRHHLEPLREELAAERDEVKSELVAVLTGTRYRRLRRDWRSWLESDPSPPQERDQSAATLAAASLHRAHRRVLRHGRAIDDGSPDAALHDLRKRAKELRYQVEAFSGLGEPEAVARAVSDLKGLQDVLGAFQDRCVQQEALVQLADRAFEHGRASVPTLLAAGMLLSGLYRQAGRERRRFGTAFGRFDTREQRAHFRALVAPRPEACS